MRRSASGTGWLHASRQTFTTLSRSFRHRNFRLFFAGQFISLIGTWMQSVALSWLVYRLTGSSLYLGLVGFAGQIPVFALSLFGGAVADYGNKRGILVATQVASMLQALALALLVFSGMADVWHVVGLAAFLGLVNAVDMPTRQSFVVEMVGKEDLHNAIALNSSMFNSARVLGPSMAGILVAVVGEGWCFFINAASYLAVIAGLLLMRLPPREDSPPKAPLLRQVGEGMAYAWRNREIRATLGLLGVASLFGTSYFVLMPIFADRILGRGAGGLGLLMAAAGAGSVVGALSLAMRKDSAGLGRWRFFAALGFGASLVLFALSSSFWLSMAILFVGGGCMIVFMASSNTLLQITTSDALRGRVMALFAMMLVGMTPFGSLFAGVLADAVGVRVTVVVSGCGCLAAALLLGVVRGLSPEARYVDKDAAA